jgi:hypothetical protein
MDVVSCLDGLPKCGLAEQGASPLAILDYHAVGGLSELIGVLKLSDQAEEAVVTQPCEML